MVAPNPLVIGFGRWTVDRIGLRKVRTPLQHGGLPAITWISRKPLYGNRAFKNEEGFLFSFLFFPLFFLLILVRNELSG